MRPFVHVNCAMSADGKIAGIERRQVTISCDEDKDRVKDKKWDVPRVMANATAALATMAAVWMIKNHYLQNHQL